MSRRRRRSRIPVTLVLPAEPPAPEEIDSIVGHAGRSGLVLILNGSQSKKALDWEWDKVPDYGALRHLTAKQIARKVGWCIDSGWLHLEYNYDGVPLLYHSPRGWERVKELWVGRLLEWFQECQENGRPQRAWTKMKTVHREIKFMVAQAIGEGGRHDLAPVLRAWFPHEVRTVRTAINRALGELGFGGLPHARVKRKA